VPVRMQNSTIGFFMFYGFRTSILKERDQRRIQHLLTRTGVRISDTDLHALFSGSNAIPVLALEAHTRLVAMAAREFARNISRQMMQPDHPLPPLAHKARRFIHSKALTEEFGMPDIARACGVSTAHLSRVFHESTGLTVTEYIARFRVEHASTLLQRHEHSITEIAFLSGFQSISQFNRTFKKVTGSAPSRMRARRSREN